jgi:hypothetical protein
MTAARRRDEKGLNRYGKIIERVFFTHFRPGMTEVQFDREELLEVAAALKIRVPKNIGDLVYSFRYRTDLPEPIIEKAPPGHSWIIMPAGRSRYRFVAAEQTHITPNPMLAETKVPDSTPGIISMYALSDEQALLAKIRYNRLVDIFSGLTCYSLQNHLRTAVAGVGQVETDEICVGIDKKGAHYVLPVQAKGGRDQLSVVQIMQDWAVCEAKFRDLVCKPIGAQFLGDDVIALFELEHGKRGVAIVAEKHYRLVLPESLSSEDLESYRSRLE